MDDYGTNPPRMRMKSLSLVSDQPSQRHALWLKVDEPSANFLFTFIWKLAKRRLVGHLIPESLRITDGFRNIKVSYRKEKKES